MHIKIVHLLIFFLLGISLNAQKEGTIEKIGDYTELSLPAIALTLVLANKDGDGAKQLLISGAINIATVLGLKTIIDKERPIMNGSSDSFPSGHTAIAFHSASFIYKRYGWKAGVPSLIASSYVGYSRIHAKKHDEWDVLAGALIGAGSALSITKSFDDKELKIEGASVFNQVGLSVMLEF